MNGVPWERAPAAARSMPGRSSGSASSIGSMKDMASVVPGANAATWAQRGRNRFARQVHTHTGYAHRRVVWFRSLATTHHALLTVVGSCAVGCSATRSALLPNTKQLLHGRTHQDNDGERSEHGPQRVAYQTRDGCDDDAVRVTLSRHERTPCEDQARGESPTERHCPAPRGHHHDSEGWRRGRMGGFEKKRPSLQREEPQEEVEEEDRREQRGPSCEHVVKDRQQPQVRFVVVHIPVRLDQNCSLAHRRSGEHWEPFGLATGEQYGIARCHPLFDQLGNANVRAVFFEESRSIEHDRELDQTRQHIPR